MLSLAVFIIVSALVVRSEVERAIRRLVREDLLTEEGRSPKGKKKRDRKDG